MITKKDIKRMRLAEKIAQISNHYRYKFGCILYKSNRVISMGVNKENSAPKSWVKKRPNMNLHAEISTILGLTKDQTKQTTLYIYGTTAKGNSIVSKPCECCLQALDKMQVKRVVYMNKGQIEELKC